MSHGQVRLERREKIGIITLDRPERRNALGEAMWEALDKVLDELEKSLPRVVVVTGEGDEAFTAGMDVNPDNPQIEPLVNAVQTGDREPGARLLRRLRGTMDRLVGLPVPLIAAVNGLAYGGGAELAIRCDLRVVDPRAVIAFSEVRLGLMPDLGGGPALARLIGPGRAADLILTARKVGAKEAFELGMVNRVAEQGKSLDEALSLAEQIARNGPRAVRSSLEILRRSAELPLSEAFALEMEKAADLIATGECAHGITAFLQREKPEFPDP